MRNNTFPAANTPRRLMYLALFSFAALYLAVVLINHYLFRTYTFDYATYNFAFFDYAHGRISPCPLYPTAGSGSFFQDHFSLTLFAFIPFYWLLTGLLGTYTLLVIQWGLIVFGAWCTYQLIALKSADYRLALLSLVYYFALLGRFNANAADCNFAIIGSAMIPAFLYYFEKKKLLPTLLCFLFLVVNREDFSLWLIFICGFLMIIHRRNKAQLKLSVILFGSSLFFLTAIFLWIIPAIEDEHKQYTLFNYTVLGKTPREALAYVIHDPVRVVQLLFINHSDNNYYNGVKAEFFIVYLLSGGCLLLLRPAYLLPVLPLLAKKMYNDFPIRWGIESYYSVELVSILPILLFLVLTQMRRRTLRLIAAALICGSTITISLIKLTTPNEQHIAMMGDSKKTNFFKQSFYKTPLDVEALHAVLDLIPPDAAVCASGSVAPHLALREKIYFFPRIDDAEFVCVLKKGDNWPITQENFDARLKELVLHEGWRVKTDHRDFLVLEKTK